MLLVWLLVPFAFSLEDDISVFFQGPLDELEPNIKGGHSLNAEQRAFLDAFDAAVSRAFAAYGAFQEGQKILSTLDIFLLQTEWRRATKDAIILKKEFEKQKHVFGQVRDLPRFLPKLAGGTGSEKSNTTTLLEYLQKQWQAQEGLERDKLPLGKVIPQVVIFSVCFCASLALLVLAWMWKWSGMYSIVLLLAVTLTCALRLIFWSFFLNTTGEGFAVSFTLHAVIDRIAGTCAVLLLMVFAFFLFEAMIATFFPSKQVLVKVLAISMIVIGVLMIVYVTVMIVVSEKVLYMAIFDASALVLSGVTVVVAMLLVTGFCVTLNWSMHIESPSKVIRNGAAMLLISVLIGGLLVARFVLLCLFSFKSQANFSKALMYVEFVSEIAIVAAALVHIWVSLLSQRLQSKKKNVQGYEPLQEVPARYSDF